MDFINRVLPQGGYRPDLYRPENIIGYTGSIHKMPTVYFMNETYFGRITQQHKLKWNIGREPVGDRFPPGYHYRIQNIVKNGVLKAREYWVANDGSDKIRIHPSRNKFIDCSRKGAKTFALLSQAIWRFPAIKYGDPKMNPATRYRNE